MKERLGRWFNNACDWSNDHPHIATILALLGVAGFVYSNLVFDFYPAMVAMVIAIVTLFYLAIYSVMKDL